MKITDKGRRSTLQRPPKGSRGSNGKTKEAVGPVCISIPAPDIRFMKCTVVGDSALITKRFSEKVKSDIIEGSSGKPKRKKVTRNPKQEFLDCLHYAKNKKPGFPASGFKLAALNAGRYVDGLKMTFLKGAFFVMGSILPIRGPKPKIREDSGKNPVTGRGVVMYRPEFWPWEVDLTIRYNADVITPEQILNLVNLSGFHSGVGEWRPSSPKKPGSFGMFHVKEGTAT